MNCASCLHSDHDHIRVKGREECIHSWGQFRKCTCHRFVAPVLESELQPGDVVQIPSVNLVNEDSPLSFPTTTPDQYPDPTTEQFGGGDSGGGGTSMDYSSTDASNTGTCDASTGSDS